MSEQQRMAQTIADKSSVSFWQGTGCSGSGAFYVGREHKAAVQAAAEGSQDRFFSGMNLPSLRRCVSTSAATRLAASSCAYSVDGCKEKWLRQYQPCVLANGFGLGRGVTARGVPNEKPDRRLLPTVENVGAVVPAEKDAMGCASSKEPSRACDDGACAAPPAATVTSSSLVEWNDSSKSLKAALPFASNPLEAPAESPKYLDTSSVDALDGSRTSSIRSMTSDAANADTATMTALASDPPSPSEQPLAAACAIEHSSLIRLVHPGSPAADSASISRGSPPPLSRTALLGTPTPPPQL